MNTPTSLVLSDSCAVGALRRVMRVPLAALLLGFLTVSGGETAWGHQRPPGCTGTGLTFGVKAFRADGVTEIPAGGDISPCETIVYVANVGSRETSFNDCDFQGGSIIIRTPDGVFHDVTPGVVPLIGRDAGAQPNVSSQPVSYTVRSQDISSGQVFASASYGCPGFPGGPPACQPPSCPPGCQPPTLHNSPSDTIGLPTGSSGAVNRVVPCPTGECVVCDPAQQFSVGGGTGRGTCVNKPATTICRASAGPCDVAESCTGNSASCPANGFKAATTICRPKASDCDVAESCPGSSATCPPDIENCPCAIMYPFSSTDPRTSVIFNESEVLRAFDPPSGVLVATFGTGKTIKAWYNDEHALVLGVRQVQVIGGGCPGTTNYPVSPMNANPGGVLNPQVGTQALNGDQAGTDTSSCSGFPDLCDRPMFPSLFITDITNDPNSKAGDWQSGGMPIPPDAVFGTWKAAVRKVDHTVSPTKITVTPDADPAKNHWNLNGGDPAPAGLVDQGYGAEVRWNVDDLIMSGQMLLGHRYRLQFMVHDGDQNKVGGDAGENCVNVTVVD